MVVIQAGLGEEKYKTILGVIHARHFSVGWVIMQRDRIGGDIVGRGWLWRIGFI